MIFFRKFSSTGLAVRYSDMRYVTDLFFHIVYLLLKKIYHSYEYFMPEYLQILLLFDMYQSKSGIFPITLNGKIK